MLRRTRLEAEPAYLGALRHGPVKFAASLQRAGELAKVARIDRDRPAKLPVKAQEGYRFPHAS